MALLGNIGEFNENLEDFSDYVDRLDAYIAANEISTTAQTNLLLATVGPSTYKLLKNLCSPDKPNTKSYAVLTQLLKEHYRPAPIIIAERHRFWTAQQSDNETVSDFVVRLKTLASTCQFGAFLKEALRDKLVSGLNTSMVRVQRQLLCTRQLTFEDARTRCIAEEMASLANTGAMGNTLRYEQTHSVQHRGGGNGSQVAGGNVYKSGNSRNVSNRDHLNKPCYRCGTSDHLPNTCRFKDATCFNCGKKGHIQRACRQGNRNHRGNMNTTFQDAGAISNVGLNTNQMNSATGDDEQVSTGSSFATAEAQYGLYNIKDKPNVINVRPNVKNNNSGGAVSENHTSSGKIKPYKVEVRLGGAVVCMEVDTGASRSTVSETVYRESLSQYPLYSANTTLHSYCGGVVPILGCITLPVSYDQGPIHTMELIIVKGDKPSLLGRDWLSHIKLNWVDVFSVNEKDGGDSHKLPPTISNGKYPTKFESLLKQHEQLFRPIADSEGIRGFEASLKLKPNAQAIFQKARPVPYSLVDNVNKEYDRLVDARIMQPVAYSEWASPVVHVTKSQGSIRVCGDYKKLNDIIEDDGYKLPNCQDLFANLAQNGVQPKVYSVIDLTGAFNQLKLDQNSTELLTINTHKGLLSPRRLCFGVKTAPSIFQATMDKILSGIPRVFCYVDDILIATNTVEEQLDILEKVFQRFEKHNVQLNRSKCQFFKGEIKYLGHLLGQQGIKPLQSKVEAIQKAPQPKNVSELKSFLGMINYYGKFVPNLASELSPLYALLHRSAEWVWDIKCEEAFQHAKKFLTGDHVLVHFDPTKPLILSVDASPYGLGSVLSHKMEDGSERPIAYASKTLSAAEKNYAQIDKEALAIVFGVSKFHLYLYGKHFTLVTDHQPLTRILGPKSGIPTLAAARMQRWALLLAGYQYDIVYRSSARNANADMLSRLPLLGQESNYVDELYSNESNMFDSLPITAKEIAASTSKDNILARAYEFTLNGWQNHCEEKEIQPYFRRRHELSLEDGCLLWGRRVIIPAQLQDRMLLELHECHPGMSRMKALARSFVWWPGLDEDIEDAVRSCPTCIETRHTPPVVPLLLWPWATEPWQRVHIDFAEIKGQQFLLLVDSHSKWLEVFPMNSTTANATITVLRSLFARYGLPRQVVTDNGPQFIAGEFKVFLKGNQIEHTLCPPYHPASNGLAEKHVQTFKRMFEKSPQMSSLQHKVANVLFHYRNIPHSTTGKSPAELFLKRGPRTRLSLVKPSLQSKVERKQTKSKQDRDGSNPKMRTFDLYQSVRVRNVRGGKDRWIPGTIVEVKGPYTYLVRVPGNNRRFVHADHLISDDTTRPNGPNPNAQDVPPMTPPWPGPPYEGGSAPETNPEGANLDYPEDENQPVVVDNPPEVNVPDQSNNGVRSYKNRYGRTITKPQWFKDYAA